MNKLVTTYWERSLTLIAIGAVGLVTVLFRRSPVAERAAGDGGRRRAVVRCDSSTEPAEPAQRAPVLERSVRRERILWWWAGIVVIVLLAQNPMFRNHLAALVAPLSLLVARFRPSWRAVVITAIITVPYQAYQLRPLLVAEGLLGRRGDGRRRAAEAAGRRVGR